MYRRQKKSKPSLSALLACVLAGHWGGASGGGMTPLKAAHATLPTERVEIRPGRILAVHARPGSRDVAIFVHGSCASQLQWLAQIEHAAAAGMTVVAYDFLGCGRSAKPHDWSCYSMDELYQDLVAIARRYGAGESSGGRNVVVAHSMGCSLALRLAAEWGTHGVNVSGLALLGATDEIPAAAASPIFRLPLCLLDRIQPLLSAGFEARALHEETRAAATPAHRELIALAKARHCPRLAAAPLTRAPPSARPLRSALPRPARRAGE